MTRVFLSWSGEPSKSVALALKQWLPHVIHALEPWTSHVDVRAGERWLDEVSEALATIDFGVICVTRVNRNSPWLNFEAGALAKSLENGRVFPYLIELPASELQGPLAQFQAVRADREGTLRLLQGISRIIDPPLDPQRVQASFEKWWPDLEASLARLPEPSERLASEGYEWPQAASVESLCAFLSRLSAMQKRIVRELLRGDERLAPAAAREFGAGSGWLIRHSQWYVGRLMKEVRLGRGELMYRCKDLAHSQLINIEHLTDTLFTVDARVVRLINQAPASVASALSSAGGDPWES